MKRRTKEILSGVLSLSILLGTPACAEAVEARQKNMDGRRMAVFQTDAHPYIGIRGEEIERISEHLPESMSGTMSEETLEAMSKEASETMSESMSKETSEVMSEAMPVVSPEETSESISEDFSETLTEKISENKANVHSEFISEEIPEVESNIDDSAMDKEKQTAYRSLCVAPQVSDEGMLDYRTYLSQAADFQITVRGSAEGQHVEDLTGAEYCLRIDNTDVVDFDEVEGTRKYDGISGTLTTRQYRIPLAVRGVGETKYTVTISGIPGYGTASYSKSVSVKNSPLYDSDFYIELTKNGQVVQYGYEDWMDYLKNSGGWVNGRIEVKLSDTGKKYFSTLRTEEQEAADIQENTAASHAMKTCVFWAEAPDRNASTRGVESGTRVYTAGIDTEAPILMDFCVESKCYEPTKTEAEQYFSEDFILKGTFRDEISGVSRIEYTADISSEKDCVWMEAEIIQRPKVQDDPAFMTDFRLVFPDGCYPAIAVRAYDQAGNVSEVKRFVNEAGDPVKVVVDRTAPVLRINMSAEDQPYNGENDHWTNKDVRIEVTSGRDSCPYAGIGQYEYAYIKIGENMTDMSLKWTEIPVQDRTSAMVDVTEDKNGYYLFRAVSKSGVKTRENVRARILIQHQAAEPRPLTIKGTDETKRKDGWYNRQSGTPEICFEYPEYDKGDTSKEYDAPITIHYKLTKKSSESASTESGEPKETKETQDEEEYEKKAMIGVMSCKNVEIQEDGSKQFVLTEDDLEHHIINFGYDSDTRTAQDGFYTLEYWITDQAGNESARQIYNYKIDCHVPTDLTIQVAGNDFTVGETSAIGYEKFYRDTVPVSADAHYGVSGKGSLKIMKAKRIGEWTGADGDSLEDADNISILPNIRCFLYIRAEDGAGNVAEGWTNGIVVDNMAPNEAEDGNGKELIIEPKGANENGFFNADFTVDINVKDAPKDGNCAALRTVSGSVGREGVDLIKDKELFSFTKEAPTEEEIIAASSFQVTQLIDAKAIESNEAYIEITAVDRSDNIKTSKQLLKIDVTKPEIEISFDNNDVANGNFYRQGRIATIHIHELNFDPDAVNVTVMKDGQPTEVIMSGWRSEGSEHYSEINFTEDGEYCIKADCVDLADNRSDEAESGMFIIDRTSPEITISLTAGAERQPTGQDCFNTGVTAVVTVTEHNFREADFIINMTPVSVKGVWSHEGDVHILRVPFDGDNVYHIDCICTDMAGNHADIVEKDFIVDTIAPVINIAGIADESANSGAILPVISVLDQNIEEMGISVSVMTGVGDTVEIATMTELDDDGNDTVWRLTLSDMTEKPDNIYYLTASACDMAGNESKLTYRFSLNRNGSVYDLTSLVQLIEDQYNTYSALQGIEIIEMNIDRIEEFELYVSRNGKIGYEAEYTREVSGSERTGYTYLYKIKKENFAEEGIYRLSLYSRDRAGNEVNNATDIHGNEISFIIDNTAPKVVVDGVRSGMVYDVEAQEVHVSVTDNFKLEEAELTLVNKANEVLKSWDYMELAGEGEELHITIPEYHGEVSLLYRVKDAAGNEIQTFQGDQLALDDFLVTTDRFVQLINKPSKTPFGRILILVTAVSGAISLSAAAIVIRKRKKRAVFEQ